MKGWGKLISAFFIGLGIFTVVQVSMPLIAYKVWELRFLSTETLLASPQNDLGAEVLGVSIGNTEDNFPIFISDLKRETKPSYHNFYISIPALNIIDAEVRVDSNDLSSSLAHLPGSALPGEKGNVFISGHSSLPALFKGGKDYGTIFANLPKIKKGEKIHLMVAGTTLTYKVEGMRIVDPTDLSVIPPPKPYERYITLMTCVPPGLNTKRLVVLGTLDL